MTEDKTKQQLQAVKEHAEAFAQYLIVGQYKGQNEMSLYYSIVAPCWRKCYKLKCESRDKDDISGFLFLTIGKSYLDKFKDSGVL